LKRCSIALCLTAFPYLVIYKHFLIWKTFSKLDIMYAVALSSDGFFFSPNLGRSYRFGLINIVTTGLFGLNSVLISGLAFGMLAYYVIFHAIGYVAVR